ncbi:hypothetical protein FXB78_05765 [Aggregatibacter actinomycetemcomitans]|uniref:hypothetical protein n=1 Tax=Aggregatibacter actinomycetemcomitans TaxID=714 RepID=UPI0011D73F73|nr:hypothetical protein [Aggregatibacter actinomycetemcomitans]TYB29173.1 hypothetical protein FXB78_05765 [Aggregatibacter actinomycetemcomitans]
MTQNDQHSPLEPLRQELAQRPNDRAITSIVARYIQLINECMDYGYSRKDIYDFIFCDKDKEIISLKYFNDNVLYRARKKFNLKPVINRSVINEPAKPKEINTIVNNEQPKAENRPMNAFEKLQARQSKNNSVMHNSGSTSEDLENTFARIINEQES